MLSYSTLPRAGKDELNYTSELRALRVFSQK